MNRIRVEVVLPGSHRGHLVRNNGFANTGAMDTMERMASGSERSPPMIAVRADAATPSRDEQRAWINGRLKAILELEINPIAPS